MTRSADQASDVNPSAKNLLLSVLGELVLPAGGSIWTSTAIEALSFLGVSAPNARQALSRLQDDGLLTAERHGRRARWTLTDAGFALLHGGAERIYSFGERQNDWGRDWLVILCSVPESERSKRHRYRSRLEFAGFGFLAPGVAVSPNVDAEPVARRILKDLELSDGATVLHSRTGSVEADQRMLEGAWDLTALATGYDKFINRFGGAEPAGIPETVAVLIGLVDAWRQFPFVDPELPSELLPPSWPGSAAGELFRCLRAEWSPIALDWFKSAEAGQSID